VTVTFSALRTRYLEDTQLGGEGATPALAAALEAIGWRAVQDPTPEELADHLLHLVDACVHEHRDISALTYHMAMALRDTGPLLDGGLPPVEAYLPAADDIVRRYVGRSASSA
jgi:hypothetical protein